jgi:hypothetical protein
MLVPLLCGSRVLAQETAPNLDDGPSIVVNANLDLQQRQDRALADAVDAYRELGATWIRANWTTAGRCELRRLCADEQYIVQVSDAYVHLLFSPVSQSPIEMAAFPLSAIQTASITMGPLPAKGTAEYSYVRLQRSLSHISRQATAERQQLYRFPDPQDNPFLPWPPHTPSSFEDISSSFRTRTSLGEIASQIRSRIAVRGYDTLRYFSVPGGFAMATDLERVGRGRPVATADRWTSGKRGGLGSLMDYWRRLLAGENDRFRVFVFIITDLDVQNDQESASSDDLRRWKATGRPSLSRQRASATALPGTRIWLYAYEFSASRSKGAELIQNERDPLRINENKTALGLQ